MRPYDLRHSFATVASRAIGNDAIVSEFLDHGDPRTTKRYTQSALPDHMRTAGAAIAAVLDAPTPARQPAPATPPAALRPRLRKRPSGA
jgi:integrase